jgi:hypothetical protein
MFIIKQFTQPILIPLNKTGYISKERLILILNMFAELNFFGIPNTSNEKIKNLKLKSGTKTESTGMFQMC